MIGLFLLQLRQLKLQVELKGSHVRAAPLPLARFEESVIEILKRTQARV